MKPVPTTQYQVLPGADGIKTAYQQMLSAPALDVICVSDQFAGVIGDYFENVVAPRLYSREIALRELLSATPANVKEEFAASEHNQRRLLPFAQPGQSDLLLDESRVALISFNREAPAAMIITDPELVASLRSQFELLWSQAK